MNNKKEVTFTKEEQAGMNATYQRLKLQMKNHIPGGSQKLVDATKILKPTTFKQNLDGEITLILTLNGTDLQDGAFGSGPKMISEVEAQKLQLEILYNLKGHGDKYVNRPLKIYDTKEDEKRDEKVKARYIELIDIAENNLKKLMRVENDKDIEKMTVKKLLELKESGETLDLKNDIKIYGGIGKSFAGENVLSVEVGYTVFNFSTQEIKKAVKYINEELAKEGESE